MKDKEIITQNDVPSADASASRRSRAFELVVDYFWLILGTLLVTVGVHFFKYPNNFVMGGVSGLSVVIGKFVPFLTPATAVSILNVFLLILGFLSLGKKIGFRTVFCSLLFSVSLDLLEIFLPITEPLTDQPFLELCFAVLLPGLGSALLFNRQGSTGGSDIFALILRKHLKIEVGRALLVADTTVVIIAFFTFGIKIGLFSLLGLLVKAFLIDSVIESINLSKYFIVVTSNPDPIVSFIETELKRGVTRWTGVGCYTEQERTILLTVMNRSQAHRMRTLIHQADPSAFVLISNTSDIIGKGFRPTN